MEEEIYKLQDHLFGKIGFIVNLSQMVEYNLANILAFNDMFKKAKGVDSSSQHLDIQAFAKEANTWYEKLQTKPLGCIIGYAKEANFFKDEAIDKFKWICEERNFVIHRLFKEDLKLKHIETDPSFYFDRLENLINEMYLMNNELCNIFNDLKKEDHLLRWVNKGENHMKDFSDYEIEFCLKRNAYCDIYHEDCSLWDKTHKEQIQQFHEVFKENDGQNQIAEDIGILFETYIDFFKNNDSFYDSFTLEEFSEKELKFMKEVISHLNPEEIYRSFSNE